MTNQDAVRVDIKDNIATVLLNRPEAMNAMNRDLFLGLQQAAQSADGVVHALREDI